MKILIIYASVTLLTLSLTGCANPSWVNKDNTIASKQKIENAKRNCNVDDKMYQWISKSSQRSLLINMQKNDSEKEKLKKYYKEKEKALHQEIAQCMDKEGLKKK